MYFKNIENLFWLETKNFDILLLKHVTFRYVIIILIFKYLNNCLKIFI